MAFDVKNFLSRAKVPAMFTMLGAILALNIKTCSDGDKSRETNDVVKSVAEQIDSVQMDVDTIKAYATATYSVAQENNTVVKRTEGKVDNVKETVDTILAHVDSCCDCNARPVVRPRRPAPRSVPRDTVPAAKPKPCPRDTVVVVVKPDTVYVPASKPVDTNRGIRLSIECVKDYKHVR
ncbi:MAG: hypothetical protein IKL95_01740 [Alphaproteobacteria bacterium]|nr:hypothetical protein [Alphaproteobacteria bacterium]